MNELLKLVSTIEGRIKKEIAAHEAQQNQNSGTTALHYQILAGEKGRFLTDLGLLKLLIKNELKISEEHPEL